MRIVKYVIAPIFLLLLIGLALLPWIDGYYFKQQYLQNVSKLSQASDYKIQIVNYKLGWLSSTATLHLTYSKAARTDIGMNINQRIYHGPFIHDPLAGWKLAFVKIISEVQPDEQFTAYFTKNKGLRSAIKLGMVMILDFNKQIALQFQLDPLATQLSPAMRFSLQSASGDMQFTKEKVLTSKYDVNGLNIQNVDNDHLTMPVLSIGITLDCSNPANCIKQGNLTIPSLSAMVMGQSYDAKNIATNWTYSISPEKMLSAKVNLNVNQVASNVLAVSPASINIELHSLNQTQFQKFLMGVAQIQAQTHAKFTQAFMLMFLAGGQHLINPNFSLTATIDTATQYGVLRSDAEVFWPKGLPMPTTAADFHKNINVRVNVLVSPAWVDRIISMAAERVDSQRAIADAKKKQPQDVMPDLKAEKAAFLKQTVAMVQNKQLTNLGASAIEVALKKHSAPDVFNSGVDQGLSKYQVVKEVVPGIKATYAKIIEDEAKSIAIIFRNLPKNNDDLKDQIKKLVDLDLITSDAAQQINILIDQNLDPSIYDSVVNNLVASNVVSLSVGAHLLSAYGAIHTDNGQPAVPSTADSMRKMLDDKVKQGYITFDNNGYSAQIVYANGQFTLNGHPIDVLSPPKPPMPAPAGTPMPGMPGKPVVPMPNAGPVPVGKPPVLPMPNTVAPPNPQQSQPNVQTQVQTKTQTTKVAPTQAPVATPQPNQVQVPTAAKPSPMSAVAPAPVQPAQASSPQSKASGITPALVPTPIPVPPEPALQ